ncbi:7180_t:CDS:2, partial [Scutellospora calospora]
NDGMDIEDDHFEEDEQNTEDQMPEIRSRTNGADESEDDDIDYFADPDELGDELNAN